MAFQKEKFPNVRLSDIDDLMRENALDSSDGQKLIDYIRRKQGASRPRPNLLLNGADNRINFRFDNLQPAPPPQQPSKEPTQTITDAAETACGPSATSSGIVFVQPHSINNRIASFVTPMKGTPLSPLRSTLCMENTAVNRIPRSPSRIPLQKSGSSGNLNRQTLIKECQRANQLKCEILRKITSSTPNAGERTQRSDDNFLSFKETISPIFEDRSADRRPASQPRSGDAVHSGLDGTVPATQDQPGAGDRNARESTPPPADEPLLVIPETPSPVRRSPTRPATPFSALRSYQSPSIRKLFEQRRMSSQSRSQQRDEAEALHSGSVDSTPQKSILKRRCTDLAPEHMVLSPSPQHRVSFCEHLNEVRVVSPAYVRSHHSSDMTTDESSEEEEEIDEAQQIRQVEKQKEASRRSTKKVVVGHRKSNSSVVWPSAPLRSAQLTRTDAIDQPIESSRPARPDGLTTAQWDTMRRQMEDIHGPESPASPSRKLRRRTLSFSDIISNGVSAPYVPPCPVVLQRIEDDVSDRENAGGQVQPNGRQSSAGVSSPTSSSRKSATGGPHRPKNRTNGIAIDMLMEDWGGSDSSDDSRSDERHSAVPPAANTQTQNSTITTPVAITTIDTPRTVMMEIFEPPSAFCDETTTGADSLPMEMDPTDGEQSATQGHDRSDTLQKRKQSMPRKHHRASSRPTVTKEADDQQNVPMKANALQQRMKSVSSPKDHVSSRMIDVVDMIHSQAASVFDDPAKDAEDSRRTTILLPTKRRRAKSTMDGDTEVYFKTVEQAGDPQKRRTKHKGGGGRERRKLFAPKLSEAALISEENIPSPEPLAMTPDDEQSTETENEEDGDRGVQSETRGKNQPTTAIEQPAIKTRSLAVVLQRLSISAIKQLDIRNRQQKDEGSLQLDNEASSSAPNSPIAEKQNSEATEKTTTAAFAKPVAEDQANEKQRKKQLKKKNPATNPGYNQKYWKDVSNELRQHVEGEGLRRSNRSRAISAQALWCNPGTDKYDAPKYKMPTAEDILRIYLASEDAKRKVSKEKAARKTKTNQGNGRARPRKPPVEAAIDADGFRVPAVPAPAPASTKPAAIRRDAAWSTSQEDESGHQSSTNNAVSLDSGISSAVMTNDDVTETLPAPRKQQQQQQQEKQQLQQPACSGTATLPPQTDGQAGGSNGSGEDVASAKRQAMDWMMMLMENQQERQEGATLMAVDIHGFTHCSIDHLTFQRRGNIEYSFYVYSKTDNFGFVRFLPNAVKKMARVTKCSLKFLIMRGSLTFAINGHEVQAVGGDFLMLSTGSSYKISNSSEVSLLFMIKTIIEPTD